MQRKNIPAYVLARGVSKKGFEQLLSDIKNAAIEEGLNKINEYQEMLDAVKAKEENTDQWVSDFMMALEETNKVINENVGKIEALFETIFVDWEKYKEENGIVEEVIVEETKEEVVEEKVDTKEDSTEKTEENKEEPKKVEKEVVETKEESKEAKEKTTDEKKEEKNVEQPTETKDETKKEEVVEEKTEEETKKSDKKEKKSKKKKSEVAEGDKDE